MSDGAGALLGVPIFIVLLLCSEGVERTLIASVFVGLVLLSVILSFAPNEEWRDRE